MKKKSIFSTILLTLATICMSMMIYMIIISDELISQHGSELADRMFIMLFGMTLFYLTLGVFINTDGKRGTIVPVFISLVFIALSLIY